MISANLKAAMSEFDAAFLSEDVANAGGTASAGTAATIYRMMHPDTAPVFAHRAPAVKGHDMN